MGIERKLLIATTNQGKVKELRHVLSDVDFALEDLSAHPDWPEAIEDGDTFLANATKKALHYAKLAGGLALADDSGLEVDALGGEPGVHSARYAGNDADDTTNNRKLIAELGSIPKEKWTARFHCTIVLATPAGVLATANGKVEGTIIETPTGDNGFGYDPHFFVPEHGLTSAQMPPELKNRISHRGQALALMKPKLSEALGAS